jgi:hypothetical protein
MTMTTPHLNEDDLVLHYYGELDTADASQAGTHLSGCEECQRAYTRLQRVLAAVDTVPAPPLGEGFERTVWARLEPALPATRGWWSWLMFSPANLAWVSAVLVLIAGAFYAGRATRPASSPSPTEVASSDQIREGVLLVDLGEHLDRSQTMLVELVSAQPEDPTIDVATERQRAEELVAANRLYRQAATQTGDVAVSELLDELERLLVEVSASPDQLPTADLERVQQRISAKDLLFKVRVVSSAIRERQKQNSRTRTGAGQSS